MEEIELSAGEIQRALEGSELRASGFRPLYFLALVVTAVAVLAIVASYFAVIVGLLYATFHYGSIFWEWMDGQAGATASLKSEFGRWFWMFIGIFVPSVLVLLMLKPLVAPRAPGREFRFKLKRGRHPAFDALVDGIARKMGMRPPTSVIVVNDVNAYASLGEGWRSIFSNRLELTVGLSLASSLSVSQLAGVIAHEYGHFSQRMGMRLSYLISVVTGWLVRIAYTRDKWDAWLYEKYESDRERDFDLIVLAVWISNAFRFVLKGVARLAAVVSSFTLRQMEYDADVPNIELSGSADFEATSLRLSEIGYAFHVALSNCEVFWMDRRVPENFPSFVAATLDGMSEETLGEVREAALERESGWYSSHPSDAARIRKAKRRDSEGILHIGAPATSLFRDWEKLAKHVTHNYYDIDLDLHVHEENLVPNAQFIGEKDQRLADQKLTERFYGEGATMLLPVALDPRAFALGATTAELWAALDAIGARLPETVEARGKISKTYFDKHVARVVCLRQAMIYVNASIPIDPAGFKVAQGTRMSIEAEQEKAARHAQLTIDAMAGHEEIYAELFRTVLNLLGREELSPLDTAALRAKFEEAWLLSQALWCYRSAVFALREFRYEAEACDDVLSFIFAPENADQSFAHAFPAAAGNVAARLERLRTRALGFFGSFPYPFEHAGGQMSIAEYASMRGAAPDGYDASSPFHRAMLESQRSRYALEHLSSLYFRLLERMAFFCESVEEYRPVDRPAAAVPQGVELLS